MPITPTIAEVRTMTTNAVDLLELIRNVAETEAGDNFIDALDTYTQSIESDFSAEMSGSAAVLRSTLSSYLSNPRIVLDPVIRTWGRHILDIDLEDPQEIFDRMKIYFNTNSEFVQSRDFTFATPTFSGATGDGIIHRLTKDRFGFDLEDQHIELKTAECTAGESTGATKNRESFRFFGSSASKDDVERDGSGAAESVDVEVTNSDESKLENSGFDSLDLANGAITSWTSSVTIDATNYTEETTELFHAAPDSNTTRKSLQINVTATLTQKLADFGITLDNDIPNFLALAYKVDEGVAGTGTLAIHLGTTTTIVTVDGKTGWQIIFLPLDKDLWTENLDEENLDVQIVWTRTAGTILIDEMVLTEMEEFDGAFYTIIGGETPFLINDTATWTDTATESILQKWFHRADYGSLPSSTFASLITVLDPT